MAEAKYEPRPVTVEQDHVVLTLTLEEAAALYDVTLHVAGSPHESRRKYIDNISTVLRSVELGRKVGINRNDIRRDVAPGIWFKSPDE